MEKETENIICGVYKLENTVNGKFYIGSAKDIYSRWDQHESMLENNRHPNNYLQHAWDKYGANNFLFSIVEICEPEKRLEREQFYLDTTNCCDHSIGYNIMTSVIMYEIPMDVRNKISETLKGKYCGEKSANSIYAEEQIKEVIQDLLDPHLKLREIADRNNVSIGVVDNVYTKKAWLHLTKDIMFPKRNTISDNAKLSKEDIPNIIEMIMSGMTDNDIAIKYNVNRKTISDIRCHKTWAKYTQDINMPSSDGLRRGSNNNMSKLTEKDVRDIKIKLQNKVSMTKLSKEYGVSVQSILNIKKEKSYKYIKISDD